MEIKKRNEEEKVLKDKKVKIREEQIKCRKLSKEKRGGRKGENEKKKKNRKNKSSNKEREEQKQLWNTE